MTSDSTNGRPAFEDAPTEDHPSDARIPRRIGPYRILGRIGAGGMGEVFLAEQTAPVRRRVALKVVRPGSDTRQVLARFEQERQALAVMNHECIAKVFDAGATEQGQPYFVMELVEGKPIDRFCEEHRLSIEARIRLFQRVCQGVQHAHQKGVMHRDLKPGNVLVTCCGGDPLPKIIDFGLARATDHQLVEQTLFTEQGRLLGTPEYMSPEQARGDSLQIDTRTDVYSLGVMLYQLLCGQLPFSSEDLREQGHLRIQEMISKEDPKRPSTRVSTVDAEARESVERSLGLDIRSLSRSLSGDLDWIVMRAMAKEPQRRYDSPSALALDLDRHLDDEPVEAGPPTFGYRFSKFVRKRRLEVTAAAVVVVALTVGIVLSLTFAQRASTARAEAEKNATLATSRAVELEVTTDHFNQLRAVVLHERVVNEARELIPAWPDRIPAIDAWRAGDVVELQAVLPRIEATLVELQTDGSADPEARAFLGETLAALSTDIRSLLDERVPELERRRRWAASIEALTLDHPNARVTWDDAARALAKADGVVASRLYARHFSDPFTRRLEPQLGLVPIGRNPITGLWEFYHLRSAWDGISDPDRLPIPTHASDGSIPIADGTGVVFVLLPGGVFNWGAQSRDPLGANYDPDAHSFEGPVRAFDMEPFFLARHELTLGQWRRLASTDLPSNPGPWTEPPQFDPQQHRPVDAVHWIDWRLADRLAREHGLGLPTEGQWEYACRAGTDTPWSTGRSEESLGGSANLKFGIGNNGSPPGTLAPNPFGLHDMHGNFWEWCQDQPRFYLFPARRAGDGFQEPTGASRRFAIRGGSWDSGPAAGRSAARRQLLESTRAADIGLRLARRLDG